MQHRKFAAGAMAGTGLRSLEAPSRPHPGRLLAILHFLAVTAAAPAGPCPASGCGPDFGDSGAGAKATVPRFLHGTSRVADARDSATKVAAVGSDRLNEATPPRLLKADSAEDPPDEAESGSNETDDNDTNASDTNASDATSPGNASNATNATGTVEPAPGPPRVTDPTPSPAPTRAPGPPHVPWIKGTWTTGYWDCCKPSCAWPRKGRVNRPMLACDARTGRIMGDSNARSVCDGGTSASCSSHQPFVAHPHLTMGFAAAAVSGNHGLTGDENCGQCFQLRFVEKMHDGGVWGGSHHHLVNKSMIVQVINIGYDVTGSHSFDIQIPGAGQGIFHHGCQSQYPGFHPGDFDCDNRYGGCHNKRGCSRLPKELQAGCRWRYEWFHWLREGGQTNNPWIEFRRVQCPRELVDITGSQPLDDDEYRAVEEADYVHGR